MKFTVSTTPLSNALDLGVVNANISKFYRKSCLAQLTATKSELRINLEASLICSELILKGQGDEEGPISTFVDCATLKSIVGTFDANTTTIEYVEGGIKLHSGSSNCNMSSIGGEEAADQELTRPELPEAGAPSVKIEHSDLEFVKNYQLYAAATTFVHPIYTRVWIGEDKNVIAGDFDNSLFTFSKKNNLGETCLLTDTIVNLFDSLPEGAELTKLADGYLITVRTDGFQYAAQFKPQYESDEGIGSYNAPVFLEMNQHDEANVVQTDAKQINKFLNQSSILSSGTSRAILLEYSNGEIHLKDDNIDGRIKAEGTCKEFAVSFNFDYLQKILGKMDEDTIKISPIIQEDESGEVVSGCIFFTKELSIILGGLE